MSKTPADANEAPVAMLWPAAPGVGQINRGSLDKVIIARTDAKKDGADITWVRARRAFRVDWFQNEKLVGTRWVMEHQVHDYAER